MFIAWILSLQFGICLWLDFFEKTVSSLCHNRWLKCYPKNILSVFEGNAMKVLAMPLSISITVSPSLDKCSINKEKAPSGKIWFCFQSQWIIIITLSTFEADGCLVATCAKNQPVLNYKCPQWFPQIRAWNQIKQVNKTINCLYVSTLNTLCPKEHNGSTRLNEVVSLKFSLHI